MSSSPPHPTGPSLDLRGLALTHRDGSPRLRPTDIQTQPGELITLVGPSGAGKTTLLRLIAGLDTPSSGSLRLDGIDHTRVAPHRRGAALLFQEPVAYPHLSVRANLAFSALARGIPGADLRANLAPLADRLGLSALLDRPPSRLSGGERQRVAIGRVLLSGARLLLLDEPFARLDVHLRDGVASLVRDWHKERGLTTLLVTHDPAEATRLADRVGVMEQGRLIAFGSPQTLYDHPSTPTVGRLVGTPAMEFMPIHIDSNRIIFHQYVSISYHEQYLNLPDGRHLLGYRPVAPSISVLSPDASPQPYTLDLQAERIAVEPLGRDRRCIYRLIGSEHTLTVIEPADGPIPPAPRATIRLDLRAVCWFADDNQRA